MIPALTLLALMAAPVIREVTPPGGQQGKAVRVTLKGDALTPSAKVITSIPGAVTKLTGEDFNLLVELKPDAPVGVYPLRVLTEDGLSNLILFSVGILPEVEEQEEEHNAVADAQPLKTPVTVNALLKGPEIDYYAIDIRAPQKLVVEIDARRAGSAIDPAFEIEDARGRVIAKNDDAPGCGVDSRAEVAFPRAGRYYIRVHDSKYSTQTANFYRLKIGRWQFAEALFPLGGSRGEEVAFEAHGGNLTNPAQIRVKIPSDAAHVPVSLPGSASLPLRALAWDTKEAKVIHDRFDKAGSKEYRWSVNPGESWVVEAYGHTAGASLADPAIRILGPDGKKLAARDDVANPNLAVPFTVPADVHEVKVVAEDLLGRSGPLYDYTLIGRRSPSDFVASALAPFVNVPAGGTAIIPIEVRRRGYDGPVKVSIADLPPGISVAGGNIPSEAAAQSFTNDNAGFRTSRGVITLTAAADVAQQFTDLKLVAVAETPQGNIVRELRGPGLSVPVRGLRQNAATASWLDMRVPFATARPLPVKLTVPSQLVRISQGVEYPMAYRAQRRPGAKPVERVRDQPMNSVGNLRILKDNPSAKADPDKGTLVLQTNFGSPVTKFDMLLQGDAEIDGKMQAVYAPVLEVDIVPGYQLLPDANPILARPGAAFEIRGRVYREPTFEGGLVKIDVQELPEGASCQPVEVPAEAREFTLSCKAGTANGQFEIFLNSVAPDVGKKAKAEYKPAPTPITLKVGN